MCKDDPALSYKMSILVIKNQMENLSGMASYFFALHLRKQTHTHGCRQDPAPFITLRLADTPDTRAMFPHKFELLYKVSEHVLGRAASPLVKGMEV